MGLDITYYQNVKQLDCVFDANGEPIDPQTRQPLPGEWTQAYVNPDFASRADDIQDQAVYAYERDGRFRAGSYSGYNWWREKLAEFAGYKPTKVERHGKSEMRFDQGAFEVEKGPFWELICFSDCEGVIGGSTCAKLSRDFEEHAARAATFDEERWQTLYRLWAEAFSTASGGGFVAFH